MAKKRPFPITGDHLLKILNDLLVKKKIESLDWGINQQERAFVISQEILRGKYSHSPIDFGEGSSVRDSFVRDSFWEDDGYGGSREYKGFLKEVGEGTESYFLLRLHSHSDVGYISPSICSLGGDRGHLLVLNSDRLDYKERFNLRVNPITGVLGRPIGSTFPIILVQEAKEEYLPLSIIKAYGDMDLVDGVHCTEQVVERLENTGLWRALALEIPKNRPLGQEYVSQLDKFAFTPEVIE